MQTNLRAIVGKYAIINLIATEFTKNEQEPSLLQFKVPADGLTKLLEKDMICQMEIPDLSPMSLKIKEISRNNGSLILNCSIIK